MGFCCSRRGRPPRRAHRRPGRGSARRCGRRRRGCAAVAYEPVWAIGTGEVATPDDAQEVCGAIRARIAELYDTDTAEQVRILYGGSVKPSTSADMVQRQLRELFRQSRRVHRRAARRAEVAADDPAYQGCLQQFLDFVSDPRYRGSAVCERVFGIQPVQMCFEWNTVSHAAD